MEDVLTSFTHLHLPGFQQNLALLLIQLADDSNRYITPADLCQNTASDAGAMHAYFGRRNGQICEQP